MESKRPGSQGELWASGDAAKRNVPGMADEDLASFEEEKGPTWLACSGKVEKGASSATWPQMESVDPMGMQYGGWVHLCSASLR